MLRRKNDILWKGVLEDVFDDFLQFLFADAEKIFDLSRGFEFLDKELAQMYPDPEQKAETRFVDKLVKAYLKDGTEQWVLVHIEVQGEPDPGFSERMFKYYCRIYDRYNRPTTAVAIFTGRNTGKMPDRHEMAFLGSELFYRYNTIHLTRLTDAELAKSNNPFALLLLGARGAFESEKGLDFDLFNRGRLVARLLYELQVPKKKIEVIMWFLANYLRFEDPETSRNFREVIELVPQNTKSMNLKELVVELHREEAKEDECLRIVSNLLAQGKLSMPEIAAVANVSEEYVKKVKDGLRK